MRQRAGFKHSGYVLELVSDEIERRTASQAWATPTKIRNTPIQIIVSRLRVTTRIMSTVNAIGSTR